MPCFTRPLLLNYHHQIRPLHINMWLSGPAAMVCAETLRQNCYEGRIIMVTKDNLPPFDKPKLSKVWTTQNGEEKKNMYPCEFVLYEKAFSPLRLWMRTAVASSSAQLTFINSTGSRCGPRRRWGASIFNQILKMYPVFVHVKKSVLCGRWCRWTRRIRQ